MTAIASKLFHGYPPAIAQSRLKINIFIFAFLSILRTIFPPYRQLRRGIIWLSDEHIQHRVRGQTSWANTGVWWLEFLLFSITVWNILEAGLSLWYPTAQLKTRSTAGVDLTPSRISSPLTRAYPTPTSSSSAAPTSPSNSTPTRPQNNMVARHTASSALARQSPSANTPLRSCPLSASTANVLQQSAKLRQSTGLFYPEDSSASPSKAARGPQEKQMASGGDGGGNAGAATSGPLGNRTGSTEEFVMVEREEKEWVENVWKGVRGKGGKVAT